MSQLINYSNPMLNYKAQQEKNTFKERDERLKQGCEMVTPGQLDEILKNLGFKIEKSNSFIYYNTGNALHYTAYSCYIIDIKTRLSFANVNFCRDPENFARMEALQKIRCNLFAFDNKKIFDL